MSRDLIRQLKSLKHGGVNPRSEWMKSNRALLLSQIKNTVPSEMSTEARLERMWAGLAIFLPRPLVYNVVRPVAVLVLVALMATTAYSGTVKASSETLPGDWLYPAKRVAEKTQGAMISLLGDKNAEAKFHGDLAQRRADEARQIVKKPDPEKTARVAASMAELKNELETVNSQFDGHDVDAAAAKDVQENTEVIKEALQDVKNELIMSTSGADKLLSKEVSETKNLAKDTSVKAVEVMVEKHLAGNSNLSKEEVKQVINTSIATAAIDALESKQTVDGAKTIVETMKQDLGTKTVSGTQEFAAKLTDVATQTKEAALKSEVASADVDKKIGEARELIVSGDLSKAVDKLKEVTDATKVVEKISDKTIEQAQQVLPIVQVIKETTGVTAVSSTVTSSLFVPTVEGTTVQSSTPKSVSSTKTSSTTP